MTLRLLKLTSLLCALILCLGVKAQSRWLARESIFSGRVVDSLTKEPIQGAVISAVTLHEGDIRTVHNFVSDKKGYFSFRRNIGIQHRMEVTSLGYKPYSTELFVGEYEQNLGLIRLSQSTLAIDEVVVKGRLQMYKMKGDTVIFLPKSVNTMMDDSAMEILRHMPGVEIDGNNIKILGQTVERTYVNQKLLFGDDPSVALRELDAKEVASIQAYDEVDEADAVVNGTNARKRKVLNVVTFKKFTQSYAANARGEMGTDFNKNEQGKRPVRYLVSGDVNFFSEKLQFMANGGSNNLTASEEGGASPYSSLRQSHAGTNISGRSDDNKHQYSALYSYVGNVNESRSSSTRDYFATEYFNSQHTEESKRDQNESDNHTLAGQYTYSNKQTIFSTEMASSLSHGSLFEQSREHIDRDGVPLSAVDRINKSCNNIRSIDWSANASQKFKDGNSLSADVKVSLRGGQSRGTRYEERTTAGVDTLLGWNTYAPSPKNSANGGVSYMLNFNKAGKLSFATDIQYQGGAERMIYTDPKTGARDLVRSEDAFDKTTMWSIGPRYAVKKGDHYISANVNYKFENRVYEDASAEVTDRRNFHFVTGRFNYNYNKANKVFSVNLSNNNRQVEAKNFSSRINDANPLYVSTGNRSLAPEKQYSLAANYNALTENSSSYGFSANITAVTNPIIYRSRFFKEQTPLPEYGNYLMVAGSTLTTPENSAAYLQFNASANYHTRITPLALLLDMSCVYAYLNPKQELYNKQERTDRHLVTLTTKITTNFSSQFRINVNNIATFVSINRFGNSDRDFRDELGASMEWDIVRNLYLKANYTGIFCVTSGQYASPNTHLLSLSVGCRVLKDRGHIAINAYDVLNDYDPIRISQTLTGISREVKYIGANFFTISFEYKFKNRRTTQ